uniref:Uncharacterized protein n=1 Tax=Glossina austeni TaxID=7395 RepID=A0A1A9V2P2_GLOAU
MCANVRTNLKTLYEFVESKRHTQLMTRHMHYDNKESSASVQIANMFPTFFQETYSDHVYDESIYPFEIKSFDIYHARVLTGEEVAMQKLKYWTRPDPDVFTLLSSAVLSAFVVGAALDFKYDLKISALFCCNVFSTATLSSLLIVSSNLRNSDTGSLVVFNAISLEFVLDVSTSTAKVLNTEAGIV